MTAAHDATRQTLLRRGFALEWATLGWNVAGMVVLAIAATAARSVALAGFGLDSLIEIGASTVVIWELSGTGQARQQRALRLIGAAFALLAVYLLIQSTWVLATGYHPRHSLAGIIWTAITAAAMFALAAGKARTGRALGNPVLRTEGRVTLIDGILATAVLAGLALNAGLGWWWADPAAGYVLVFYATRKSTRSSHPATSPGGRTRRRAHPPGHDRPARHRRGMVALLTSAGRSAFTALRRGLSDQAGTDPADSPVQHPGSYDGRQGQLAWPSAFCLLPSAEVRRVREEDAAEHRFVHWPLV